LEMQIGLGYYQDYCPPALYEDKGRGAEDK
jgi:hypothetical protein